MRLAENTPLLPGESIMSWVSRIARDQAGMTSFDFLNFIEFSRKDILEGTPWGLDQLTAITGTPRAVIKAAACLRISERFYEHRGHRFHAEFGAFGRTTFCPRCLLEDARADGPSRGRRVGRVNWFFSTFRTCPVHGVPLYRVPQLSYAERFQDMAFVAPGDRLLEELATNASAREVSPLQGYVANRLDGKEGPAWLDSQQIDLGTRASEMLGACLLFGAHVNLIDLSEDQWDAAGAEGFAFTSRGEEGVREALDGMFVRFRTKNATGGPQAIFGRLFQWLQFNKSSKTRGPIQEVVREFILDTTSVEPGSRLFGEPVTERRRHSVASLAKQTELHRRTLNRALVLTGLLPGGAVDRIDPFLTVDAEAGERLADLMLASIPVVEIPAYLNCNRRQAEMLVHHDIVKRIGGSTATDTILNMVPMADLDDFLLRLRRAGVPVDSPGQGMVDLIEASERVRWPVIDIVRLVLDGSLSRIELLPAERKFKSVFVNPEEVRFVSCESQGRGRLSLAEAAARLSMEIWCVRTLMTNPDRNGRPFLPAFVSANVKGVQRHFLDQNDLEQFAATHVDLKTLAQEKHVSAKALRKRLSEAGVEPILPRTKLNKLIYRRADL
jgi:hypothetical protein